MKRPIFKFSALSVLIILVVCLMCACSGKYELSDEKISTEPLESVSLIKAVNLRRQKKLRSSGTISLYYDEKTASVTVRDGKTGFNWYSLPTYISDKAKVSPCVLSLEVLYGGKTYYLDSQKDALKNGEVTAEEKKTGITVTYRFKMPTDDGNYLDITAAVKYKLMDSNLYVSIDCADISFGETPKKAVLTKINLLGYFGASRNSSESDYILVPDNCGAVIRLKSVSKDESRYSYKVYGGEDSAVVGAYGMRKKGTNPRTNEKTQNAFAAIIQKGAAIAEINAYTKESDVGYNTVSASFNVTEYSLSENKGKTYANIAGTSYDGEIKLCYRFLTGTKADYSGMAIACREQFIRDGVLSAGHVRAGGTLPVLISVIGAAKTGRSEPSVLTSYDQLQDMLTHLKSKGFVDIFINYRGTLLGGLEQKEISSAQFINALGTEKERKELQSYISAQGMTLFTEVGYVTFSGAGRKPTAKDCAGKNTLPASENCFGFSESRSAVSLSEIENCTNDLLRFIRNNSVGGVCVSDAAAVLYSDSSRSATREDIKDEISRQNSSIPAHTTLMVKTGNFYAIKNAAFISDVKLSTRYPESESYECVPFTLLMLHGTLDYGTKPINYSDDYSKAMLRCIEYGAVPEFEWCYEYVSYDGEENDKMNRYSYADWATEAYAFYEKANKVLGSLRDERMTSHRMVQQGLYCSEYGGTSVYVNYTDKDIELSSLGITVPAKDFVRIN